MTSGSSRTVGAAGLCRGCGAPYDREVWSEGTYRVLGCPSCGLAALEPLPEPGNLQDIYREEYFRKYYLAFEEFRIKYFRQHVADMEPYAPGRRLLDVGCGVGYFLRAAVSRGWESAGIEPSPFASRYAREYFGLPVRNMEFGPGVPGAPFDAVTFWDVLAHIPRPGNYLQWAREALKPGGVVVVKSPDRSRIFWRAIRCLSVAVRTRGLLHVPAQVNFFSRENMQALLDMIGFEILRVRSIDEIRVPLGSFSAKILAERSFHRVLKCAGTRESFIIYARRR